MKLERLEHRATAWDAALRAHLAALRANPAGKPVVLIGDLNVAFHDMDVHTPSTNRNKTPGFCDAERDNFALLLADGFHDVFREAHPTKQQFT